MTTNETHKEKMMRKKLERKNRSGSKVTENAFNANRDIERSIYNRTPTMINEDDYVPMNCVLCGSEMKTVHNTNSPNPITDLCYAKESLETGNPNRCCNECDGRFVTPIRMYYASNGWNFQDKDEILLEMVMNELSKKVA
jgi:hypothetical protein